MSSQRRRFLVVSIAAIVVIGGTASLGQWQFRRAAQKEALQLSLQTKNKLASLNTAALLQLTDPVQDRDRVVSLQGRWIVEKTVFLDNRPMDNKTGFWVYTPLLLAGSNASVLVQRGWVPRNFLDRAQLPQVETPPGAVTVTGRIAPPPSKLYSFNAVESGQIRQNIDVASFRQESGLALLNMSVVQTGPASEGLKRNWPAPDLGVDKHHGYALQWFALSGLTVGLYCWFQGVVQWRRRRMRRAELDQEPT